MSKATLIEQIKGDLDYLKLVRSAEVFAQLAERHDARCGPARVPRRPFERRG
jgi:hypothetical protein